MNTTLKVGIDDCGSGLFNGYTCVVLSKAAVPDFSLEGRGLLLDAGLQRFHGKEFNPGNSLQLFAYEKFLELVGTFMEKHQGYAAFCLSDSVARRNYETAVQRVMSEVVRDRSGHPAPTFFPEKAPVLDWFCRGVVPQLLHRRPVLLDVEVDRAQIFDGERGQQLIGIRGSQAACLLPAHEVLALAGNGLLRHAGASWARFEKLAFVDPIDSMLTQAADVLSNFGVLHLRTQLRTGPQSEREREGSRMFRKVFGDEQVPADHQLAVHPEKNILIGTMSHEFWLRCAPE